MSLHEQLADIIHTEFDYGEVVRADWIQQVLGVRYCRVEADGAVLFYMDGLAQLRRIQEALLDRHAKWMRHEDDEREWHIVPPERIAERATLDYFAEQKRLAERTHRLHEAAVRALNGAASPRTETAIEKFTRAALREDGSITRRARRLSGLG